MSFPDWTTLPAPVISVAALLWVLWKVGLLKKGNGNGQPIRRAGSEATEYWTQLQNENKQEILDAIEQMRVEILATLRKKIGER